MSKAEAMGHSKAALLPALPLALIAALVLLRWVFAPFLGLVPDEAYYWSYGQHLALGYLDHPPLVGWSAWLSTTLVGRTEFAVRLPALVAGLATIFFAGRLGADSFGARAGIWTAALAAGLPFFFLFGTILTPDPLLIAAWTAALAYAGRALVDGRPGAWLGLALAFGAGLLAKYVIVLLGLALLAFMLWDKGARRWFFRPHPYLAGLLALALFMPVLIWNASHGWASFWFQSVRRFEAEPEFGLHRMVLHNLVLVTPVVVALLPWFLRTPPDAETRERRIRRLLVLAFALPLGLFLAYTLYNRAHPHWSGPAWIAALPLLGAAIARAEIAGRRAIPRLMAGTLAVLAALYAAVLGYAAVGLPGNPIAIANRHWFWRETALAIDGLAGSVASLTGQEPLIVGMSKWSIAAALQFYSRSERPELITSQHLFGREATMHETWFDPTLARGRPVVVVAFREKDLDKATGLTGAGRPERLLVRDEHGRVLRDVWVLVATGIEPKAPLRSPH